MMVHRGLVLAAAFTTTLAGCVAAPEPSSVQQPSMLVAYPGPGKTEPAFRQDDASCRAAVTQPQAAAQYVPPEPPPPGGFTPGMLYLRCMVVHGDVVQPIVPEQALAYGYYPAYPVFAQYGEYYPWLYAGSPFGFGFGFYGGYGFREGRFFRDEGFRGGYREGGFREGGFRDGGFRDGSFRDGSFRGGEGREGGFRGGGGFRDGGGGRGGGFRH